MSTQFSGTGNLGAEPGLRTVTVDGEERQVCDMRIFFDRRKKDGDEYVDNGGFWVTASVWGWRAAATAKLLDKGVRVFAMGSLRTESWTGDDGEERSGLRLDVDYITVDLLGVEKITFSGKKKPASTSGA